MQNNLKEFSTFPGSVKKGIGFLMAGWVLFYVFIFYCIDGQTLPIRVKVVGILCVLCILTLKNWARVICLLCHIMVFLQFGFVFVGFFAAGKTQLAGITGAMLLMFGISSFYLLKKDAVAFFKRKKDEEATTP
ncbi:MAG: hypothetical protein V1793_13425 [Pseudomonadota bacterium]